MHRNSFRQAHLLSYDEDTAGKDLTQEIKRFLDKITTDKNTTQGQPSSDLHFLNLSAENLQDPQELMREGWTPTFAQGETLLRAARKYAQGSKLRPRAVQTRWARPPKFLEPQNPAHLFV